MDNDTVASVNKIVNTDNNDEEYNPATGSCALQEAEIAKVEQTSLLDSAPTNE